MPTLCSCSFPVAAACAAALVLAGCSSEPPLPAPSATTAAGPSAAGPSADEIIDAFDAVRGASERPFLVGPVVGSGSAPLETFRAPDSGYSVVVRCFGEVGVSLSDPAAVDAGLYELDAAGLEPGTCPGTGGMLGAGRDSTGGPVEVTLTAGQDVYWVAGVTVGDEPAR